MRWVVEWVNSSLKRFKYIDGIVPSYGVPHLFVDVRILAAIHNHFFARQYSNFDRVEVAYQMIEKMKTPNLLQELVEKKNLTRKACMFETLESDHFHNLPAWSIEELSSYLSSFQLRLEKTYLANHFAKREHEFQISRERSMPNFSRHNIFVQNPVFIRARLLSRHVSNKVYFIFIVIDRPDVNRVPPQSIKEAYCTCKTGSRTVEVCVHVASIIWYIFYGRHDSSFKSPAAFLDNSYLLPSRDGPSDLEEGDDKFDDF